MNIKLFNRKVLYFLTMVLAISLLTGCGSGKDSASDSDNLVTIDSLEIDEQLIQDVKTVKEILQFFC